MPRKKGSRIRSNFALRVKLSENEKEPPFRLERKEKPDEECLYLVRPGVTGAYCPCEYHDDDRGAAECFRDRKHSIVREFITNDHIGYDPTTQVTRALKICTPLPQDLLQKAFLNPELALRFMTVYEQPYLPTIGDLSYQTDRITILCPSCRQKAFGSARDKTLPGMGESNVVSCRVCGLAFTLTRYALPLLSLYFAKYGRSKQVPEWEPMTGPLRVWITGDVIAQVILYLPQKFRVRGKDGEKTFKSVEERILLPTGLTLPEIYNCLFNGTPRLPDDIMWLCAGYPELMEAYLKSAGGLVALLLLVSIA